ncbi:MAG: CPBP family intramembrane metalloprotease [Clostridia bacterium]|nr:CPBP family intramembrane metalloprotease [Clostridia bacterium]
MKNKKIFLIGLVYFVAMVLVAIVFVLGAFGIITNSMISSVLIQVVSIFAVPLLMYTLLISKSPKQTFKDIGFNKVSKKVVLVSIALGFVLYFINLFVADFFQSIISLFGYESVSLTKTVTETGYLSLLKDLIFTCLFPALFEEFLHRGILLNAGKKYGNTRVALLISSLLFGLMHLNINQFFYAAILGFLMGNVVLASNSIIPSIIIHFINNFLSTLVTYGAQFKWSPLGFIETITEVLMSNVFMFVLTLSLFILLLFMLYSVLIKILLKERAKKEVLQIIRSLNLEHAPLSELKMQFEKTDEILQLTKQTDFLVSKKKNVQVGFTEKLFYICSVVLGATITLSSFVWGII